MSVLAAIAGIVLIFVGVFSPDPPATYAWAPGLILLMVGLAGEARVRRPQQRRVPPRALRIRVDSTRGFERGQTISYGGAPHEIVAVDTLEGEIYVRPGGGR